MWTLDVKHNGFFGLHSQWIIDEYDQFSMITD